MTRILNKKISCIGSGNIGGIIALLAILKGYDEVVLYDIKEPLAKGKALDLSHLIAIIGSNNHIIGTNNIEDIKDSDVCIISAGFPRKQGMSRNDLITTNLPIIKQLALDISKYSPHSFVIVITNPLDVMSYYMWKYSGLESNKVIGMAGTLDSGRYKFHLSDSTGIGIDQISTSVLGSHGEEMVLIKSQTTISGSKIEDRVNKELLDSIEKRVKNSGAEVISLLGNSSSFFSPASAAIELAESYRFNSKRRFEVSTLSKGNYGINDIYIGLPVIIDSTGVREIVDFKLTTEELKDLQNSAETIRGLLDKV